MKSQEQDPNLLCIICTELALNAMETSCCGQLICQKCSNELIRRNLCCPNCRTSLRIKQSTLARRLISSIQTQCKQCKQKISMKSLQVHEQKCRKRKIKCKVCQQIIQLGTTTQHMIDKHQNKLNQLCAEFQLKEEAQQQLQGCDKLIQSFAKNKKGVRCELGSVNKYYCGRRMDIRCPCCDGSCGLNSGQNCDDCMEADFLRLNLVKGFLVNTVGNVSKYDYASKQFYCGLLVDEEDDEKRCRLNNSCQACLDLSRSIRLGRYKNLI